MLYFSDVSDVLFQSIFKLNDDEKLSTSITISESQLVIMVKFNPHHHHHHPKTIQGKS